MKYMKLNKYLFFVSFLFATVSCTTTKPTKQHLTHPEAPRQAPSVIAKQEQKVAGDNKIDNKNVDKIIVEQTLIENAFIGQNCDSVLEHARVLQSLTTGIDFTKQPSVIQAAIYTCDGRAGLNDANRLKLAVTNLKSVTLRYPFINEAWVHNTLADFYAALNDKENAVSEKKQARDLLLAQQQDISSLNMEILKLDPSQANTTVTPSTEAQPSNANVQSVDQIISSATQLINNDSPEQAIALLDTIPASQRTENTKRIRMEAVNNLVSNLRFKVRALFVRSTEQTGAAKKDSLQQCEQILKGIIQNYPDYKDMSAVLNNLKQVQRELSRT